MESVITRLQELGFSQYEAMAYIALLQSSPLNGYELAKASGVPRPNIYRVLQKLEERGAVVVLQEEGGRRYAPVDVQELIQRLEAHFHTSLEAASHSLEEIAQQSPGEQVWTIHGYSAVLEHASSLALQAGRELLLAVWPPEAHAIHPVIASAEERGVRVTTLCLPACSELCGACRGQVFRLDTGAPEEGRWLVVVSDESEMIAAEIRSSQAAIGVRTRQPLFTALASAYITHTIALSALLQEHEGLEIPQTTRRLHELLAALGQEGGPTAHRPQEGER